MIKRQSSKDRQQLRANTVHSESLFSFHTFQSRFFLVAFSAIYSRGILDLNNETFLHILHLKVIVGEINFSNGNKTCLLLLSTPFNLTCFDITNRESHSVSGVLDFYEKLLRLKRDKNCTSCIPNVYRAIVEKVSSSSVVPSNTFSQKRICYAGYY